MTVMCDIYLDSKEDINDTLDTIMNTLIKCNYALIHTRYATYAESNKEPIVVTIYNTGQEFITISITSENDDNALDLCRRMLREIKYKTYLIRHLKHGEKCSC